jgi:hypothetical protein
MDCSTDAMPKINSYAERSQNQSSQVGEQQPLADASAPPQQVLATPSRKKSSNNTSVGADADRVAMMMRIETPGDTPVSVSERKKLFEGTRPPQAADRGAVNSATSATSVTSSTLTASATQSAMPCEAVLKNSSSLNVNAASAPLPHVPLLPQVRKDLFQGPLSESALLEEIPLGQAVSGNALPADAAQAHQALLEIIPTGEGVPAQQSKAPRTPLRMNPATCPTSQQRHGIDDRENRAPANNVDCDRLASGVRRDDLERPKSLKAAEAAKEQAKLQDERRRREKYEREQERERCRTAAAAQALEQSASAPALIAATTGHTSPNKSRRPQQHFAAAASGSLIAEPVRRGKLAPAKAGENYEISDHGNSECEDTGRIVHEREKKHIPAWCENYHEKALAQINVDADTVFGSRVPFCNLEQIFPDSLYRQYAKKRPQRQRRRGSSADWHKDRLTQNEVCAYKSRMGHGRSMANLLESSPQQNDN